jgi:hypothetical protein
MPCFRIRVEALKSGIRFKHSDDSSTQGQRQAFGPKVTAFGLEMRLFPFRVCLKYRRVYGVEAGSR